MARKRKLKIFMDECLLRNKDEAQPPSPEWCCRRRVHRCLMIILLVEKAKEIKLIPGNLFQLSSSHKASQSVLAGITHFVLPFERGRAAAVHLFAKTLARGPRYLPHQILYRNVMRYGEKVYRRILADNNL